MTAILASSPFSDAPLSGTPRPFLPQGEHQAAAFAPFSIHRVEGGSRSAPDEGAKPVPAFAIDAESTADAAARDALIDRAMGPRWRSKSSEKLRRGRRPSEGLAFVAKDAAGQLVGTVRLWNIALGQGGTSALLLGPLAVEPALKGAGIGSALMRHALAEAGRLGHGAVLLVGDAPYYGRFGFSADRTGGLAMPGPFEKHRLLAAELVAGALDGVAGTIVPTGRRAKAGAMRAAA